jgi:hypothetical protein
MKGTDTSTDVAEPQAARYPCPACGARLYGWSAARNPVDRSKIVLDRCEECGLIVTRDPQPPLVAGELAALARQGEEIIAPNRRSWQAGIGGAQWAGLEPERRRLHMTPDSARLLLAGQDAEVTAIRTPFGIGSYLGLVQTLINGFTLRDNLLRNLRSGRLRPQRPRDSAAVALDVVVSVLVAVPMAVIALPVELLASALGRGGSMRLRQGPGPVGGPP